MQIPFHMKPAEYQMADSTYPLHRELNTSPVPSCHARALLLFCESFYGGVHLRKTKHTVHIIICTANRPLGAMHRRMAARSAYSQIAAVDDRDGEGVLRREAHQPRPLLPKVIHR